MVRSNTYARTNVAEIIFSGAPADAPASANPAPVAPRRSHLSVREPDWVVKGPDYAGAPFSRGASGFLALEKGVRLRRRAAEASTAWVAEDRYTAFRADAQMCGSRQGQKIVFVVRFDGSGDARQFQLFRLESGRITAGKRRRRWVAVRRACRSTIQKVGDSVYELTPTRALPAVASIR